MSSIFYKQEVIQLCSSYATVAHKGQFRKDKITPYIVHPARVASNFSNFIVISAAWLHDVLEDCSEIIDGEYSYFIKNHEGMDKQITSFLLCNDKIEREDGEKILKMVDALTMSQNKTVPKKERKLKYYQDIKKADPSVSSIKYYDRIDNLITVDRFTQKGFEYYLEDTEIMIKELDDIMKAISPLTCCCLNETLKEVKNKYNELYGKAVEC